MVKVSKIELMVLNLVANKKNEAIIIQIIKALLGNANPNTRLISNMGF